MNRTTTDTTTRMMTPQSPSPSILNHESSFFSHDHTRFTSTTSNISSNNDNNSNCNMFFIDSRANPSSLSSSSSQGALLLLQQQPQKQHQSPPSTTLSPQRPTRSLVPNKMKLPFPYKLHQLLTDLESMGRQDIAGWLPGGKSFRIDDPQVFAETVMTSYFRQSKFTSFIRQLYIYGFAKIESGSEVGGYWHPEFRKSDRTLCLTLGRNSIPVDRRCKKKKKKGISNSISSSSTSGNKATRKVQSSKKKTKTSTTSKVIRLLPPSPQQQLSSSTIPFASASTPTTTLIAKEDSFTSCIDAIPELSVSLPRRSYSKNFFPTSYSSTSSMLNATFPPLVSTSGIEGMVVVGEGNREDDDHHHIVNQDSSLLCLLDLEPRSIEEMMLQQS